MVQSHVFVPKDLLLRLAVAPYVLQANFPVTRIARLAPRAPQDSSPPMREHSRARCVRVDFSRPNPKAPRALLAMKTGAQETVQIPVSTEIGMVFAKVVGLVRARR